MDISYVTSIASPPKAIKGSILKFITFSKSFPFKSSIRNEQSANACVVLRYIEFSVVENVPFPENVK